MIINKTGIRRSGIVLLLFAACFIYSCKDPIPAPTPTAPATFVTDPERFAIEPEVIDEASGLTASINFAGYLWTLQDSQSPASLYLISPDGKKIKEYPVPDAENRDWEDLTCGPGPENGRSYLYIGDIGNNNMPLSEVCTIYRLPEINDINGSFISDQIKKIQFKYPDGVRDAETLLLDPVTKDIFVISKEMSQAGIYRLAYPQSTSEIITAEKVGVIPSMTMATSGSISSDGTEIMVRNYISVFYWKKRQEQTVSETISKNYISLLSIVLEPQGEGICFDRQGTGFYTFSERGGAAAVTLNYYKRN